MATRRQKLLAVSRRCEGYFAMDQYEEAIAEFNWLLDRDLDGVSATRMTASRCPSILPAGHGGVQCARDDHPRTTLAANL